MEDTKSYASHLAPYLTNPTLSTQKLRLSASDWLDVVMEHNGVGLAAHAFTPHKGVYGNCVSQLDEMFIDPRIVLGLELGLSADTQMAQWITDTHAYPYISNSDAHFLRTSAENLPYTEMSILNFENWVKA